MHIGLIGGIGPASTEFYYRHLVRAHALAQRRLELTIVHADVADLGRHMAAGAPDAQARIFAGLTERLKAAGADVVAITSMGGHFCVREFEALSPLRVANAIPDVRAALVGGGFRRVGLLGTRVVMATRLYGGLDGLESVVPLDDEFEATHREYVAMAGIGEVSEAQRLFFHDAGERLCREQGADVVLLAGTDLFLAFDGRSCSFGTVDCARVHIDALCRLAWEGAAS